MKSLLVLILLLSACASPTRSGTMPLNGDHDPAAAARPVTPRGDLTEEEKKTIALFRAAAPSVVFITSRWSGNRDDEVTGSGIIWDARGRIVTNQHVLEGADSATVELADGSEWEAKLIGLHADKDLAVLQIAAPAEKLHPIAIGTSEDLKIGQRVYAIGNPFGFDGTLTTGVISALDREIEGGAGRAIRGAIQTDAVINPGNSGGPLLDSAGRLIGINTSFYAPGGTNVGIGFAIPVDTVNRVVPRLIRKGRIDRPELGFRIADDQVAARHHVEGVMVTKVIPGGLAEKAGLRAAKLDAKGALVIGDVVVEINGSEIKDMDDFLDALEGIEEGQAVGLQVLRDGTRTKIQLR